MSGDCAASDVATVVVIGASGFIGEHLLKVLVERKGIEVRVLVHRNRTKDHPNINFIEGDLLKPDSLNALLSENCTVINLAYLADHNLDAMSNLVKACAKSQVKRLIHCSTAVVAGRVKGNWVNEKTQSIPVSEYEKTKLRIEEVLLETASDKFELTILRPTAVFGPEGKNLLKLANELMTANMWVNYVRSCLFSRRSMNLVCVENVASALAFLSTCKKVNREIFIISDDDSPINNYCDIEKRLMKSFGKSYSVPRIFVPRFFLGALLRLSGKSNINPSVKFSDQKLAVRGFKKPQNLEKAIDDFAAWHKKTYTI